MELAQPDTEPLFAYGTLLDGAVQTMVFGRTFSGDADTLMGYIKTSVALDGERYPNVMPAENGRVEGRVLHLTAHELALADAYETESYARIRVALESGRQAWLYVAPANSSVISVTHP